MAEVTKRTVRPTRDSDLDTLDAMFASARNRMAEGGNPDQWHTYPNAAVVKEDMRLSHSFVITEPDENGCEQVIGTFVFFAGVDPTYLEIEGDWIDNGPYGVIHRIAGNGTAKGILRTAVAFAKEHVRSLRVDTHRDNKPMQGALRKEGFTECGIIYCINDLGERSPRIAFQKVFD